MKVVCPYCTKPAALVDSAEIYSGRSYGMIWLCRRCDAYVGTHKTDGKHVPLGTLANRELREWRKKAHSVFDQLWKYTEGCKATKKMTRGAAYKLLQQIMGKPPEQAHIGLFDVNECKVLVSKLSNFVVQI